VAGEREHAAGAMRWRVEHERWRDGNSVGSTVRRRSLIVISYAVLTALLPLLKTFLVPLLPVVPSDL